ncbi:hypothetical protein ccbrp13_65000 [Ktedonobacteria bacterium brp13]|nr:hypothetical protein ccbrp13_65000 [Ktedonobacteria bacterium brp13]
MLLKMRRILVVIFAFIIYIALLTDTNLAAISSGQILHVYFATSALSALIFLSVGSFVWLYASDRRVALSLLGFCFALMVTFSVENRSPDDRILICLGEIGSVGAILCLSYLLIVFPSRGRQVSFSFSLMDGDAQRPWLGKCVLGISSLLGIVLVVLSIYATFIESHYYNLILMANYIFFVIILIVVLAHTRIFFLRSATRRDRQQLFLFVWGIIIAAAPLLFLSLVPLLFNFNYAIDPRISSVTMCFFPLALGYSILRYQILVFDTYVRRVVSTVAGIAFVIICVAAIVALGSRGILPYLWAHKPHYEVYPLYIFVVSGLSAFVAPFALWFARLVTERLFFREILHYQRVLNEPFLVTDEVMSVDDAASLITSAAVHTFNTSSACVFSFDEEHGLFVLYPELEEEPRDTVRRTLLASLQRRIAPVASEEQHHAALQACLPLFERLAVARRPLLLSEALRSASEDPVGVRRYLSVDSPLEGEDWLLAPLRAQGKIIGLLVLGERGDQQPYAGPDLEAAHWLLNRFSPVLEAARLYERAHQNAALLNRLYHVSMMPGYAFKTIEEAARIYTRVAAESTMATAEIWLCEGKNSVRRAAVVNVAGDFDEQASLFKQDHLILPRMNDWQPYFFRGEDSAHLSSEVVLPSCLPSPPAKAFAWLPLQKDMRHLGILMIAYDGYHSFAREEMRVLEMFANQYVATLENVRMTNDLLEYNERLQEVDSLKDQFMTTASHELRTPLTTVAGYIELLNQYQGELPGEMRADFIEKARRGCDELTLLINNITDASQVSVDVEHIRLRPIMLPVLIDDVLEIVETMLNSEQRQINVSLAPDVSVVADEIRLRQVLMNLLNNALKYSDERTAIDISSQVEGQYVFITVSDHGMGIPLDEQMDIFERFMRMERDMNSPVRGAGLGLYICRQLIEAMGGQIWVESSGRVGEGSRFIFSLCKAVESHSVEGQQYASIHPSVVAGDVMKPSVS